MGNDQTGLLSKLAPWLLPILSLFLAVLSAVLGYLALKQPEPEVVFEIISETNVFDVHRSLQDLDIIFRGEDVRQQNLNLRIVAINVVNSGEVNILTTHYDQEDDWGLKFTNGDVIEARLIETDSDYLRSKITPQILGQDAVAFPKVIFDKGASFAIEVLLLHQKDESPSISAIGKIAGINEITVLTQPLTADESEAASDSFFGGTYIDILISTMSVVAASMSISVLMTIFLSIKRRRSQG